MQDQFSEIIYLVKGIIRNKWMITIVAWVLCIGGWTVVYKLPNLYESSARVHVDTRSMLRPLLRGLAIQTNVRGLVMVMQKLMFTRHNMLKVAELSGIDIDLKEEEIHALVLELKEKVKIEGGRDEIFVIKSESSEPLQAKNIVQAVLTVFSEQTQQSSTSDVDAAQRFIDNQIKEFEQRLRNAEKARENFKRANIGLLPGQSGGGQFSEIQTLRDNLDKANMIYAELRSKKRVLADQLEEALDSGEEWGLTEIIGSPSNEDSRISQLLETKDQLLLRYTDIHPKITSIDQLITSLQERNEDNDGFEEENPDAKAMANPYVQSIKINLNTLDTDIATINSRINIYKQKLQKEDTQYNSRLAIETEMKSLNRDYETIKINYTGLLDRREKARMSSKIDSQVSALKFKIIDPANLPLEPSSPQRVLFYIGVLIISYVAGTLLSLFLVILRPTFAESKQLREVTGLPILGVISKVVNSKQSKQNKYQILKYALANILLVVGCSGLIFLNFVS